MQKERKKIFLEKLKLQWVSDVVGDSYKNWKFGDIITIDAQTGCGKTHLITDVLIDHCQYYGYRILYICNRTNLKRMLKIDLLKRFHLSIPYIRDKAGHTTDEIDIVALDKISYIGNVMVTSYHALQHTLLDKEYGYEKDYGTWEYIVADEIQYLIHDAAYNNGCRFAYQYLLEQDHPESILICLSATMQEIKHEIKQVVKRPVIPYSTGRDYSYVNPYYFKNIDTILALIKNDKTSDKWLIFVSSCDDGSAIYKELGDDVCSFIKSGTKSDELNSIIMHGKFDKKVLISTSTLDNGINLKDSALKNVVIMTWNNISFIQMLGRKRMDIMNPESVNLYIPMRSKKSFLQKLYHGQKKLKQIKEYKDDYNEFCHKYDNNLKKLGKYNELFYHDNQSGKWKINKMGVKKLNFDIEFFQRTYDKFKCSGDDYSFVKVQLKWIGLSKMFDPYRLLTDIHDNHDVDNLSDYLQNNIGKIYCTKADKQEIIEKIGLIDVNHSRLKSEPVHIVYAQSIDTLNGYLNELNLDYIIKSENAKITKNKKTKYFKTAWKLYKLNGLPTPNN